MSDSEADPRTRELVLEYELDASPEKVWRAISIPAFRERWLPGEALSDGEAVASIAGEEIGYRMRESEPPFLESVVTFRIRANAKGGTDLTIIHRLPAEADAVRRPSVRNDNRTPLMRAA